MLTRQSPPMLTNRSNETHYPTSIQATNTSDTDTQVTLPRASNVPFQRGVQRAVSNCRVIDCASQNENQQNNTHSYIIGARPPWGVPNLPPRPRGGCVSHSKTIARTTRNSSCIACELVRQSFSCDYTGTEPCFGREGCVTRVSSTLRLHFPMATFFHAAEINKLSLQSLSLIHI